MEPNCFTMLFSKSNMDDNPVYHCIAILTDILFILIIYL